ncbi:hypothetical protein [Acidaminococcus timonensis]|uniref:hypothetical protein n=1 Tax=Acidaminococcus timonensis TaxID=1871002 RepID=UPI0026ECA5AA|nr:hypothetical protein [Acidaminococcus timonensis]
MKNLATYFRIITWTIAIFFYYFQVPFYEYAGLITLSIALFMLLDIKNIFKIFINPKIGLLYIGTAMFCMISILYGISNGAELTSSFRFLLILLLLPMCPFYQEISANGLYKVFSVLSLGKAIMLITIACMVILAGSYTGMREWALLNDYGDIYTVYGGIPRVQLRGNALLVIAFMISFQKNNKFTLYNILILLGVLSAGNIAFLLGIVIFFIWHYVQMMRRSTNGLRKIIVSLVLAVAMAFFMSYLVLAANSKSEGYFSSNGMRILQFEALTDTNILYGNGLGSPVWGAVQMGRSVTAQYYELQTLYIYYQVGIVCLMAFYILVSYSMVKFCNKSGFIIFLIYLFYSFFNPYCFDTTQMITMIILSNQFPRVVIGDKT